MLTIYKDCDTKEDFIWTIDIKERYTEIRYNEMMNRFKKHSKDCYDVDESFETGEISLWHLSAMINFLKK